jgi:hypothetical protein
MRSDFVTFFGPRDHNGLVAYQQQVESRSWFAYSVGDPSNAVDADLVKVLQQQGGVIVQIDAQAAGAPKMIVGTWKGVGYEPPVALLVLHIDRGPEWLELKAGTREITLETGDHVMLPLDRNCQQTLENLRQNLEYLPLDYEMTILNVLRRPSLEWRVSRLERAIRSGRPASDAPVSGTEAKASGGRLRWNNLNVFRLTVVFLLILLVAAGYFLLTPHSPGAPKQEQRMGTATRISSATSPSNPEAPVILIATVTGTSSGRTPSGTVKLLEGNQTIEAKQLDFAGSAQFQISSLVPGTHQITGQYSGDTTFLTSGSNIVQITIPKPNLDRPGIEASKTQTTLQSNADVATLGSPVTFTTTVSSTNRKSPVGLVRFLVDNQPFAAKRLNSGGASLTISNLSSATHKIQAIYLGNQEFQRSNSNVVSQVINPLPVRAKLDTRTSLAYIPKTRGQTAKIEVRVECINSTVIPNGLVEIFNNERRFRGKPLSSDGIADFEIAELQLDPGSYRFTATYLGSPEFLGSSSSEKLKIK